MILNVYKPKNWTSFDVVAKLRGILGIKKIGHAGTLDPLAEGVLVVLTEKDTKRQSEIMKMQKEYKAEIAFGAKSPTYDLEGTLSFSDIKDKGDLLERLKEILPSYIGEIEQTVPPYSAKKVKGQKLYKKARSGTLDLSTLPTKKVEVVDIKIDEFSKEDVCGHTLPVLKCTIVCGSGTYIRSIAHDLGEDLEVGGVLIKLIRARVGDYKVEEAKTLESLASRQHTQQ